MKLTSCLALGALGHSFLLLGCTSGEASGNGDGLDAASAAPALRALAGVVLAGGQPVEGARLRVDGVDAGATDETGSFVLARLEPSVSLTVDGSTAVAPVGSLATVTLGLELDGPGFRQLEHPIVLPDLAADTTSEGFLALDADGSVLSVVRVVGATPFVELRGGVGTRFSVDGAPTENVRLSVSLVGGSSLPAALPSDRLLIAAALVQPERAVVAPGLDLRLPDLLGLDSGRSLDLLFLDPTEREWRAVELDPSAGIREAEGARFAEALGAIERGGWYAFVLRGGGECSVSFTGRVVDAATVDAADPANPGGGVAGVSVRLATGAFATTDLEGRFRIENVPVGPGCVPRPVAFDVLTPALTGAVRFGSVVPAERIVAGEEVLLFESDPLALSLVEVGAVSGELVGPIATGRPVQLLELPGLALARLVVPAGGTFLATRLDPGGYRASYVFEGDDEPAELDFEVGRNFVTFVSIERDGAPTLGTNAPELLSYALGSATYTVGVPIAPNVPSVVGAVSAYSAQPALPATLGLQLDADTGRLTGAPLEEFPATTFEVTALNAFGSTTAELRIEVVNVPPADLSYAEASAAYLVGVPIDPNAPSVSGNVDAYSVLPTLPPGLSVEPTSGVISGTPTAVAALREYTVVATNSGGSATTSIEVRVDAPAIQLPTIIGADPLPNSVLPADHFLTADLTIDFDRAMDFATFGGNVRLESAGADGLFGTADDTAFPFTLSSANDASRAVVAIDAALPATLYDLIVDGGVLDTNGNPLDVNGDGSPGESFFLPFSTFDLGGCVSPPPGLTAWWDAEGGAVDLVAGSEAQVLGSTAFVPGKVGRCFSFDSDDDGVRILDEALGDVSPQGITVEFWMRAEPDQDAQDEWTVLDKSHGQAVTGWAFQGNANGGLRFAVGPGQLPYVGPTTTFSLLDGELHHVAGVWDGLNVELYVDGALAGSVPNALGVVANNDGPLNVGFWGESAGREFRGQVDEISMYQRPLAPSEVAAIVEGDVVGKCTPCTAEPGGQLHAWTGDRGFTDSVGFEDGVPVGDVSFAPGYVGSAFDFDGDNDYVELGLEAGEFGTGDFTVELWAFVRDGTREQILIENYFELGGDSTVDGWSLAYQPLGGTEVFAFFGNGNFTLSTGALDVGTDRWHHIAVTREGELLSMFVDGAPGPSLAGVSDNVSLPDEPMEIGRRTGTQGQDDLDLDGLIDEVGLYGRALSALEIAAIFDAGAAGKCRKDPIVYTRNVSFEAPGSVAAFRASPNGGLTELPGSPFDDGGSGGALITSVAPQALAADPTGEFLFSSTTDADQSGLVATFRRSATGDLVSPPGSPFFVSPGLTGSLVVSDAGRLYVVASDVDQGDSSILQLAVQPDGSLSELFSPVATQTVIAEIALGRDDSVLYATSLQGNVTSFGISEDGSLLAEVLAADTASPTLGMAFDEGTDRLFVSAGTNGAALLHVFDAGGPGLTEVAGSPFSTGVTGAAGSLRLTRDGSKAYMVTGLFGLGELSLNAFALDAAGAPALLPKSPHPLQLTNLVPTLALTHDETRVATLSGRFAEIFAAAPDGSLASLGPVDIVTDLVPDPTSLLLLD